MNDTNRFEKNDDWKNTAVELGVIGGVGVGIGAALMRGRASGVAEGSKKAAKRVSKDVDRYLDRAVFKKRPIGRFFYKTLKKVPGQSSKIKRELDVALEPLNIDLKAVGRKVQESREQAVMKELANAHLEGRPPLPPEQLFDPKRAERQFIAQAGEAWRNGQPSPLVRQGQKNGDPSTKTKQGNLWDEGIGGAVSGLGFAAGLTAFHALDNKLIGENEKKDRSYEASGSLIGGTHMNKQAGSASDLYDNLNEFGKKVPNAVATGIGFTGVTLGTASLLEKVRADARKKAEKELLQEELESVDRPDVPGPKGKRRRKNDMLESVHVMSASHPGRYMLTQQAASGDGLLEKLAGNPFDTVIGKIKKSPFIEDVRGHGKTRRQLLDRLDNHNYELEAIRTFDDEALEQATEPYLRVHDPVKAKEKGLADLANELKDADQDHHDKLYEQMAKARLQLGGGVATGFGLAGLAHRGMKEGDR